jgi:acetyl-CoA carboxylase biotin carboxyl carrier protein
MAEKTVRSPFPGTFYRRPNPDAGPYVSEGDEVEPGDIIGLIEIMKNFYEVRVEEKGVVDRFLVGNEETIEVGQVIVVLAG